MSAVHGASEPAGARSGAKIFGLDLVRAAAILLVLASHGSDMACRWAGRAPILPLSYGAYCGIELFFVLSGFLIGGLLLRENPSAVAAAPARRWAIFMARRWLRTLPLYYVWLGVLVLFWAPVLWPGRPWPMLAPVLPAYLAVSQNVLHPPQLADFFDVSWSLAVEEWFYLLVSAAWFTLVGPLRTRAMPIILALVIAGPIALRALHPLAPGASDHVVPLWLDSIGIGVGAAYVAARWPVWFRRAAWLSPVGLAAVAFALFGGGLRALGFGAPAARALGVDWVAVGLVLQLPLAVRWGSAQGTLAGLVRWIARLSYGLYLVHLSVLVLMDLKRQAWGLGPLSALGASAVASVGIALLLHHGIEAPVMRRRPGGREAISANPSSSALPSAEAA